MPFLLPLIKYTLTKELLFKLMRTHHGHNLVDELFNKALKVAQKTDTKLDDEAFLILKDLVHQELGLDD